MGERGGREHCYCHLTRHFTLQFEAAKETLLRACKESPSSRTWFGVGVACYQLDDLEQAEDALSEANILNNQDPEIWAYLTMVCIKVSVVTERNMTLHILSLAADSEASGG